MARPKARVLTTCLKLVFPLPPPSLSSCNEHQHRDLKKTMFPRILSPFLFFTILAGLGAARDSCGEVLQDRLDCYDSDDPCEPLPIPDTGFGFAVDPSKGYHIETLRPGGLYVVTEGSYLFLVLLAEAGAIKKRSGKKSKKGKSEEDDEEGPLFEVAIIDFPEGNFVLRDDTGMAIGSLVTDAVDEIVFDMNMLATSDISKVQMVYSHAHFDHIGSATFTYDHIVNNWMVDEKDIDIVAEEGVLLEFEERIEADFFSYRAPLPTTPIRGERKKTLPVGKDMAYTALPVNGHSEDKDLAIFIEATQEYPAVLMFVDVVFPGWAAFFSFAIASDIFDFLHVHKVLLDEFELGDDGIFVGGHLSKLGSKSDIELSRDFTLAVLDGAALGLETVDVGEVFAGSGVGDPESNNFGNSWLLFDLYFIEVVRVCAKEVLAQYGCKLAALDIVLDSHCRSAQSFWRLDF